MRWASAGLILSPRKPSAGPATAQDLIKAIKKRTGRDIQILSGAEEAHYATLGVISGFYRPKGLVGDMGGGSLEVAEALEDHVGERSVSLPLGALPVEAMMEELGDGAKRRIDEIMKGQLPPLLTKPVFHAVGGGWRALARAHMEATGAPLMVAHGYDVDAGELRNFAKTVWKMAPDKLADLPGVSSRRSATIPAAALVMDRLLKNLQPERVVFSALGVREGWLYAQLTPEEQRLDPLIEGAQAFGLPAARVPDFAPALVRWTDQLFPDETEEERRLRVAACALSDIAWADHADVKAQECFRRIVHFPFIGLTHPERVFIGATLHARHAGKPDDPTIQKALTLITPSIHRRAQILGRALQLGHRFSGSVPAILDIGAPAHHERRRPAGSRGRRRGYPGQRGGSGTDEAVGEGSRRTQDRVRGLTKLRSTTRPGACEPCAGMPSNSRVSNDTKVTMLHRTMNRVEARHGACRGKRSAAHLCLCGADKCQSIPSFLITYARADTSPRANHRPANQTTTI